MQIKLHYQRLYFAIYRRKKTGSGRWRLSVIRLMLLLQSYGSDGFATRNISNMRLQQTLQKCLAQNTGWCTVFCVNRIKDNKSSSKKSVIRDTIYHFLHLSHCFLKHSQKNRRCACSESLNLFTARISSPLHCQRCSGIQNVYRIVSEF